MEGAVVVEQISHAPESNRRACHTVCSDVFIHINHGTTITFTSPYLMGEPYVRAPPYSRFFTTPVRTSRTQYPHLTCTVAIRTCRSFYLGSHDFGSFATMLNRHCMPWNRTRESAMLSVRTRTFLYKPQYDHYLFNK